MLTDFYMLPVGNYDDYTDFKHYQIILPKTEFWLSKRSPIHLKNNHEPKSIGNLLQSKNIYFINMTWRSISILIYYMTQWNPSIIANLQRLTE